MGRARARVLSAAAWAADDAMCGAIHAAAYLGPHANERSYCPAVTAGGGYGSRWPESYLQRHACRAGLRQEKVVPILAGQRTMGAARGWMHGA
jgi:hypothetical protein